MGSVRFGKGFTKFRYAMMAPYAAAFVLVGVVGYQLTNLLSAEPLAQTGVGITTSKPQYEVGEIVRFTIVNVTDASVFVANNCPAEPLEVYRWENSTWMRLHAVTDAAKCVNEPRVYEIAPQARVSATYRYWPELFNTPGRYRLAVPLENFTDLPTAEFVVSN